MQNKKKVVFASPHDTIDKVYKKISFNSSIVNYPGIAIIVNKKNIIEGIITDGDFRRAYLKKINFNQKIINMMIKNPILIDCDEVLETIPDIINKKIAKLKRLKNGIKHIIFVDKFKRFVDIKYLDDIYNNIEPSKITILGLGYVGLTLAAHISNSGFFVSGVDLDKEKIKLLNKNKVHIFEPGLEEMIKVNKRAKNLVFHDKIITPSDIYVIAVGTPIINNKANRDYIINAVNMISKFLKKNDHIVLRSTVEVGTTRNLVIPLIKKLKNFLPGKDYSISFAPERTVEGNALKELKLIPQIIGGFSENCTKKSLSFWNKISNSTITVANLESAELIKLANNTFRDLSFAFSNELGLICSKFNIDAHELIKSANSGYIRNPIPKPSPGVGGYCLSKDPLIYSRIAKKYLIKNDLGQAARNINKKTINSIILLIKNYSKHINKKLSKINILIVGVAFKGLPETNDTRSSSALHIKDLLENKINKFYAWDAVLKKKEILNLNFTNYNSLKKISKECDIILVLNNHPKNEKSIFIEKRKNCKKLIFDGWGMYGKDEIRKIEGLSYSNIGYKIFV